MNENDRILPEESPPPRAASCEDCIQAGLHTRIVWGEGNPQAQILLLLDNPGAREDREGNPYLCGTRDTLLDGLGQVGIRPEEVYVTYLLKRRPLRKYDKPLARRLCFSHLQDQLAEKQPKLLFGFGNVVSQFLFGEDESADVKYLRGKWHDFRGIPTGFTYHPLAVRRRPVLHQYFLSDLQLLSERYLQSVHPS